MAVNTMKIFSQMLFTEMIKQGGWKRVIARKDPDGAIFIPKGKYAGQHSFSRTGDKVKYQWRLHLDEGVDNNAGKFRRWRVDHGEDHPLYLHRQEKVVAATKSRYKEFEDKVKESLGEDVLYHYVSRQSDEITAWVWSQGLFNNFEDLRKEYMQRPTAIRYEKEKSHLLDRLPLMWEVGESSMEEVLAAVSEKPERLHLISKAWSIFHDLGSYKEKQKFMKNFMRTWNLHSSAPVYIQKFAKSKELINLIAQRKAGVGAKYWRYMPQDAMIHLKQRARREATSVDKVMENMGLRERSIIDAKQFLKTRGEIRVVVGLAIKGGNLDTILDTIHTFNRLPDAFILGMRNGRKLLDAYQAERWLYLIHPTRQDQMRAIADEWVNLKATKNQEKVQKFIDFCPDFGIEGVVQLKKTSEFLKEGREMNHCVGGYAHQMRFWTFSITTNEGRTTLGMYPDGRLHQHYGMHNMKCFSKNKAIEEQMRSMLKKKTKVK